MTREGHVRFCESAGVRFPRATRPFIKVKGCSVYLYRAIDRDGNLVDVLLRVKRDKAAAELSFAPRAPSLVVFRRGSPVMDTPLIPEPSKQC